MTCNKGFKPAVSQLYNRICLSQLIQLDSQQINKWKPRSCNGLPPLLFTLIMCFTNMFGMLDLHVTISHLQQGWLKDALRRHIPNKHKWKRRFMPKRKKKSTCAQKWLQSCTQPSLNPQLGIVWIQTRRFTATEQSSWVRIHAPSLDNSGHTRCLKDEDGRWANRQSGASAANNMMDAVQKSGFCTAWCYADRFGVNQVKHFGWDWERPCAFWMQTNARALTYKHRLQMTQSREGELQVKVCRYRWTILEQTRDLILRDCAVYCRDFSFFRQRGVVLFFNCSLSQEQRKEKYQLMNYFWSQDKIIKGGSGLFSTWRSSHLFKGISFSSWCYDQINHVKYYYLVRIVQFNAVNIFNNQ